MCENGCPKRVRFAPDTTAGPGYWRPMVTCKARSTFAAGTTAPHRLARRGAAEINDNRRLSGRAAPLVFKAEPFAWRVLAI